MSYSVWSKILNPVMRKHGLNMNLCVRKPTIKVPTRSDTNQPVQSQKIARSFKFQMKEEGLHYPCSEDKGADQLRSN